MTSMAAALHEQYSVVQLQDASVVVAQGQQDAVARELAGVAGVAAVEPSDAARVTLAYQGATYTTDLQGFEPGTTMHGFVCGGPGGGVCPPTACSPGAASPTGCTSRSATP